ncbi:MAG: hypothetical protein ACP5ON_11505 [Bacteroidota bacterium]
MKRRFIALLSLTLFLALSSTAQTVVGSKHDLSASGGITDKSTTESQVCISCHTPHQKGMTANPLWNHTLDNGFIRGLLKSNIERNTI